MTIEAQASQLSKAESALALVKTEAQLTVWHDTYMAGEEYLAMSDTDARTLEQLHQKAIVRVAFPGAGVL